MRTFEISSANMLACSSRRPLQKRRRTAYSRWNATGAGRSGTTHAWKEPTHIGNSLENGFPDLADNWRWQMNLLRATYDVYVRRRLLHEEALEREANAALRTAGTAGAENGHAAGDRTF